MKNIVICCDGTRNQFSGDQTNLIRTYKVAQRFADAGGKVCFDFKQSSLARECPVHFIGVWEMGSSVGYISSLQ